MDTDAVERFARLMTFTLRGRIVGHKDDPGVAYQIECVGPSGRVLLADGRTNFGDSYLDEPRRDPPDPKRLHGAVVDPKDLL